MSMDRMTASFPESIIKRVRKLAKKWKVSEGEVMRRLMGVGDFIIKANEEGAEIYSEKEGEKVKLVIPF